MTFIEAHLSLLRLQALLMKAGIASERDEFQLPVANMDELVKVRTLLNLELPSAHIELPQPSPAQALEAWRGTPSGMLSSSVVVLKLGETPPPTSYPYRTARPTIVRLPVVLFETDHELVAALTKFKEDIKRGLSKKGRGDGELYWSAGIRREGGELTISLQLDVDRAVSAPVPVNLREHISSVLGLPTEIQLGMAAVTLGDRWAGSTHNRIRPGQSISTAEEGSGCTVTSIVKRRTPPAGQESERFVLTVGHAMSQNAKVYQPAGMVAIDRLIGTVVGGEFRPMHNGRIQFDAALIRLDPKEGANSVGADGLVINQLDARPEGEQSGYFYGATSGLRAVRLRREELAAEVKGTSPDGAAIRLYYTGLIEIVAQDPENQNKPVAAPGDSGAPVIMKRDGNHSLVGYVVASGLRAGESRRPRTYALPADILFDFADLDLA